MSPALNNSPKRLEQIVANNRNIYGSGNKFILPVIPVQGFQQQFWERFKLSSIFERERCPFWERYYFPSTPVEEQGEGFFQAL
jgi:hypothetical protein